MKAIYVIEDMHIYKNDHKRFQLKYFEEKGLEVEMWSMVRWTFKNCDDPRELYKSENVFYIDNKSDLVKNFERIKSDDCIFLCYPYHSYTDASYNLRKMIKKYGYEYCNISSSPAVGKQRLIETKNKIILLFMQILRLVKLTKDAIVKHKIDIICNGFLGSTGPYLYPSKYNFITTKLANAGFPNWVELGNKVKNIMIHAEAYDEYLDAESHADEYIKIKEQFNIPDKYIVFIDDFEVGHSDFKKLGEKLPVTNPTEYLKTLDKFFIILETKFDMPVVVAEHPKAEYEDGDLGNRKLIKGYTNFLIKNSSFVIIGASTCIAMMVQCKKDYIGYYSSEFFENVPRLRLTYKLIQEMLGVKYIDIRNKEQLGNIDSYINTYDDNVCAKYISKYVVDKEGIYKKHFYEVVADMML